MKDVSPEYLEDTQRTSGSMPVTLLTIDHPDLLTPIRLADTGENFVSRSETYLAWAFTITPPSDIEDSVSTAQITIDNTTRDLVAWLELTNGGKGTSVLIEIVLYDYPDDVEWSFDMDLSNVTISMTSLVGYLAFPDLVNMPAVSYKFDVRNARGLF